MRRPRHGAMFTQWRRSRLFALKLLDARSKSSERGLLLARDWMALWGTLWPYLLFAAASRRLASFHSRTHNSVHKQPTLFILVSYFTYLIL